MEIRHIDIDVSVKKFDGEEEGKNVYKSLFNRRMRIDTQIPIHMDDEVFRQFMHGQLDKILDELKFYMEVK